MATLRTGLSYDDVLLEPKRSAVDSRSDVDLKTQIAPSITLDVPILSAAMDTVTEHEMATALATTGGMGVVHRFLTPEEQAKEVQLAAQEKQPIAAAVGIDEDYIDRAARLIEAGAACLVVDVAHGHMERCLQAVDSLRKEYPDTPLIAGNVATPAGVEDLYSAGADGIKIGIGPGSHCTTREVAGTGIPQFTAVKDCTEAAAKYGVSIIADGGIQTPGDAAKAIGAGADAVMIGGRFAGTDESPAELVKRDGQRFKRSRGMASASANEDRSDKAQSDVIVEGTEALTPYVGPVADVIDELTGGIRSGCSYAGASTIEEFHQRATFIRVAPGAAQRHGEHGNHQFSTGN